MQGLFYLAKIKVLISCAVTAQLICVFVYAYAKSMFLHDTVSNYVPPHSVVAKINVKNQNVFRITSY